MLKIWPARYCSCVDMLCYEIGPANVFVHNMCQALNSERVILATSLFKDILHSINLSSRRAQIKPFNTTENSGPWNAGRAPAASEAGQLWNRVIR